MTNSTYLRTPANQSTHIKSVQRIFTNTVGHTDALEVQATQVLHTDLRKTYMMYQQQSVFKKEDAMQITTLPEMREGVV